ncbi:Hypothetical predicted protein [Cloeon dipterum]|uniref:Uncharacterized protein n=1 Tax=Cloeon dipterum TaxID=197152 RepID=A0A8S1DHC5_9INSE|nr:Hypothetical predicted protein [Cloeon dipterum]
MNNAMKGRETGRKNLVSAVANKKLTSTVLNSAKQSAPASCGNSSSSSSAVKTAEDFQTEADIVYSQYLQAAYIQKMMAEKNAQIDEALKEIFSVAQGSGLQNPNVDHINKCTEKLKHLKEEHSRLLKLKEEVMALQKSCQEN